MKLMFKTAVFTVLVPGTFAVLIPLLVVAEGTAVSGVRRALAVCFFALGTVVYLRSAWDFAVSGKGTPAPIDAPKRLVTRGFYRYIRNPMYVASLSLITAWAILFESAVLFAYAVALFAFFSLFVRFYEEPRLAREFGDEYATYKQRVGRWLPRQPGSGLG